MRIQLCGRAFDQEPSSGTSRSFPLIPGKREFDYQLAKKYFDGKAVILHVDGSVTSLLIDKSGKVYLYGKDLFDPSQPFWQGKAPDVKWPE